MKRFDETIQDELSASFGGRVCIVGVGNRQRGDDGAGPRVIDAGQGATRGVWIDAGMTPENFLEPIVRTSPDTVLIVDAVDFGGISGECRLLDMEVIDRMTISTHTGSIAMFGEYLQVRTGVQLRVIGIQPATIDAGEGLSDQVEASVHQLAELLLDLLALASDNEDT